MTTATSPRRRSLAARLANTVVNIAVVAAMMGAVAWIAPSLLGYERYVITGGSMSGSIDKGSVVFSRPTPVPDLAVGDVITYLPPPDSGVTTLVTHRITRIGRDADGSRTLRTRGDANGVVDPWRFALTSDLQPVVVVQVPLAGHVVTAMADRSTRMVVIGIPAALVALVALGQLAAGLRRPTARPADPTTTRLQPLTADA